MRNNSRFTNPLYGPSPRVLKIKNLVKQGYTFKESSDIVNNMYINFKKYYSSGAGSSPHRGAAGSSSLDKNSKFKEGKDKKLIKEFSSGYSALENIIKSDDSPYNKQLKIEETIREI